MRIVEVTQNSLKTINNTWVSQHPRTVRSPTKNREKEIDQKLKVITKSINDFQKTTDCSTDPGSHCRDHSLHEALLNLAVRVARRNNNKNATKRERQINDQHIKINKLLDRMKKVTDCVGKKEVPIKGNDQNKGIKDDENEDGQSKTGYESGSETDTDGGEEPSGAGEKEDEREEKETEDEKQAKEDEKSECDYRHFEDSHTMLLPPNDCMIHHTGVSEEDKKHILFLHNSLRARVARGEETEGNPGPQPPAVDMRELVWNDQLAEVAEAWAKQCHQYHDQPGARKICAKNYHVGQNLHFYYGFSPEVSWEDAVNAWYIEVKDLPNDLVVSFRSLKPIKIGHYTQVVWAETTEVGCGIVHYMAEISGNAYPESKIYACNYGPAGNVKTLPIYNEGPTGSECPLGLSSNYPDLCAPDT
ncbi:Peptidase inhibitor 16 [Halocaridina rubra]|uniref:Peptidase inhibitor 16 n=1 Tax=Halocaridina rubra TaxID=373956 RepID=A0AAN8WZS6_HALRR